MTPEARAAAQVALARHTPYLFSDIPEGMGIAEYRLTRPRKRTFWQRLVRRLNGHG